MKKTVAEIFKQEFTADLASELAERALDSCPVDEQLLMELGMTALLSESARLFFKAGIEVGLRNA